MEVVGCGQWLRLVRYLWGVPSIGLWFNYRSKAVTRNSLYQLRWKKQQINHHVQGSKPSWLQSQVNIKILGGVASGMLDVIDWHRWNRKTWASLLPRARYSVYPIVSCRHYNGSSCKPFWPLHRHGWITHRVLYSPIPHSESLQLRYFQSVYN